MPKKLSKGYFILFLKPLKKHQGLHSLESTGLPKNFNGSCENPMLYFMVQMDPIPFSHLVMHCPVENTEFTDLTFFFQMLLSNIRQSYLLISLSLSAERPLCTGKLLESWWLTEIIQNSDFHWKVWSFPIATNSVVYPDGLISFIF